ncbi:MAG: primosomal protein N', partial [Acidobacteriota bacterium]|nr:primosomal protein N' [Acidobacteriota bacterium]
MVTDSAARTSQEPTNTVIYVDVALPVPLSGSYTYRLRNSSDVPLKLGTRVLVPFGKRKLTGYCVATHNELDKESGLNDTRIRDVIEVVDEEPLLTPEILALTQWAAGYYASSWGEMLKGSLPAGINSLVTPVLTINPAVASQDRGYSAKYAMITEHIRAAGGATREEISSVFGERNSKRALADLVDAGILIRAYRVEEGKTRVLTRKAAILNSDTPEPANESQRRVVECLRRFPEGLLIAELKERTGVSDSPLKTLAKKGFLKLVDREIERDPFAGASNEKRGEHVLTNEQATALGQITKAVDSGAYKAFLLKGVTGSGKTEVYIHAMKRVLEKGRTALMLVPEIALTPVFSQQLRSIFGKKVAILHSSLSTGERFDEWRRIRRGEARVVIGTRSAVFAPLEDLGLIVVDEEHDSSYRQHEMPFYHGRDTAIVRANRSNAVVVLGSATPALESFRNAETGKYEKLVLAKRISGRPLATAELIDMREVVSGEGKKPALSNQLCEAISETHKTGEQTMILLNRRGFSQFVLCRSCGESIRCRNCEITLTFHKKVRKLICHYCNYRISTPDTCPGCESRFLYFLGEGTEQVEDMLRERFPELRIARVDRDTTRKKRELERILKS